jgi:hypothetical protein
VREKDKLEGRWKQNKVKNQKIRYNEKRGKRRK